MRVRGTELSVSILLLAASGVLLLLGLPLLLKGNFAVWFAAKAVFGVGAVLFLLDK